MPALFFLFGLCALALGIAIVASAQSALHEQLAAIMVACGFMLFGFAAILAQLEDLAHHARRVADAQEAALALWRKARDGRRAAGRD